MKVRELIEQLSNIDPEMEVIVQKDAEGNGYSPLYSIDTEAVYFPDSTYSGEVFRTYWSADDCCMEQDEWEEMQSKPRSVILEPTN